MLPQDFWIPEIRRGVRAEPFRAYLIGFGEALLSAGHSHVSISMYLRAAAHLGCWLEKAGAGLEAIDQPVLQAFAEHLTRCRCPGRKRALSSVVITRVTSFVAHLRQVGVLAPTCTEGRIEPLIFQGFRAWMIQQRGATDATVERYRSAVIALLESLGEDPAAYTASKLRRFVLERSKNYVPATTKKLVTAVRMFLRCCMTEGTCPIGLDAAIPTVANWRLASLPAYLPQAAVDRVVAACDLNTRVGIRDRAILLLVSRLGLRAGDIVGMRISDIDWADASVKLMGKGRREVRLPLPQDVGDSVLAYLEEGRPKFDSDRLFVCGAAPLRPFSSRMAISSLVQRAMSRAGVSSSSSGVRVLRHSAATAMLRDGATLQEIGKMLRHRSVETTALYAKVDFVRLRQVAQPWPEVAQC